ncbi:hypothetical protein LZ495_31975 [Yinghuangia sp. KLBMP8922]|uniref:Uncharacterized protein n=2 Tax=Yinghuangia soli TaxID=2908204 RepID=A0AA41U3H2_9ACTN|nr:hypothetical protein [Yinghuangia soli]
MIRASLAAARAHPDEFLTLSNSWTHIRRAPELAGIVVRRDAGRALWADALAAGVADGSLRAGLDPGEVLRIIFSALHGSLDHRFDVPEAAAAPAGSADTLVALLLDGLRPRPEPRTESAG